MPSTWSEPPWSAKTDYASSDGAGYVTSMSSSSPDEALQHGPGSFLLQLLELKWFGSLSSGSGGSNSSGSGYHDSVNSFGHDKRAEGPHALPPGKGAAVNRPSQHNLPRTRLQASEAQRCSPSPAQDRQPPDQSDKADSSGASERLSCTGRTSGSGSPALDNLTVRGGLSRGAPSTHATDLGTWAKRQTRFWPANGKDDRSQAGPSPAALPSAPWAAGGSGSSTASQQAASPSPAVPGLASLSVAGALESRGDGVGVGQLASGGGDEAEAGLREAAWRWRFGRRWQLEQAKQFDPTYGQEGDEEDGWEAALGYLDACGPGWHLQLARTTSVDKNLGYSLVSHGSDLSTLLLEESQREGTLREHADMDATKSIASVARKARDLYEQQQEIEKQVEQRWCHASSQEQAAWVGAHLQSVQIDSAGKFTFVLVKVWDRQGRNRLLIRGKSHCSEAQLVQHVSQEVMRVISAQRLPNVVVTLLGSGTMEWSRERDRRLDVYQGRVVVGSDANIMSRMDVARLAGALTRASLPMHYHLFVESVAVAK